MTLITSDQTQLFNTSWRVQEPVANLLIVHGMGEHILRYDYWAKLWNKANYNVFGFDLRGHGQSHGKRGHINSFQELMDDVLENIKLLQQEAPHLPLVIYGHSMGGNIVLNLLKNNLIEPNCAIITSPWIELAFQPSSFKLKLAQFANKFLPSFSQPTELDVKAISQDPEVVKNYQNDKLVHSQITARMFYEVFNKGVQLLENFSSPCPLLLIHGGADKITSFEATQHLAQKTPNSTFIPFEGGFHELHNEPFKHEVFLSLLEWSNQQLHIK